MKNSLETRLGLFFALAIVVAAIILEMAGSMDVFRKGYPVTSTFDNVQELKEGDQVKMAGVPIGYVDEITLVGTEARVTMTIYDQYLIKTDSTAIIKFIGLMGRNYIAIEGGTMESPAAEPGAALAAGEQPDLSELMAKLEGVAGGVEGLTKSFSPENFSSLLGPITDFMKQNSGRLTAIVGNMQTVSENIAEGRGTVGRLINTDEFYVAAFDAVTNLQSASSGLSGIMEKADSFISLANETISGVNQGQGTLGRLTTDETLYTETTAAMGSLRQILEKINTGEGSIGELVNDKTLIKNAQYGLQKVEKATEGLEDQGPLSLIGLLVSPLF